MSDAECPYCGKEVEICHDDGYGYAEDELYEQHCCHCDKTFGYTTSISYYYDTKQVACLNGEPHKMKPKPRYEFPYLKECEECGHCEKGKHVPVEINLD